MLNTRCALCGAKRPRESKELVEGGRCGRCKEPVQPSSEPVHVSEEELVRVSNELSIPLVTMFTTRSCPRTKSMERVLGQVAERFASKALILVVDVESAENDLAGRLWLKETPMFVVAKGERLLLRHDGVAELSEVTRWIRTAAVA